MKKTLALILIFALMLCGTAMAETLTMGSSIDFAPYEYYDDETGEIVLTRSPRSLVMARTRP